MEEILTVFDEAGTPVGEATRKEIHQKGLLHEVAHIWVVSQIEGTTWLWFQQRAFTKADFPGFYDTAVGGHIAAGEDPLPAAVREMGEEIGLFVQPHALRYLGDQRDETRLPGFFDREIAHVYLYEHPSPAFAPGEEVERMVRVRLADYIRHEDGAPSTPAVTQAGEEVTVQRREWCRHPGEFRNLLLPRLTK